MNFDEYQTAAERTIAKPPAPHDVLIFALGIAGEGGEVCEILKKAHGHGVPLDLGALREELGDLLWYLSAVASAHNLSLDRIAAFNIAKLRRRYPDGFAPGGGNRGGVNADA